MKKFTIAALGVVLASGTLTIVAAAQGGEKSNNRGGDRGSEMLEQVDTNGDGNISMEEIDAAKAAKFAAADLDGDGGVTIAEMQAAAEAKRAEREAAWRQNAFSKVDADEDGRITLEEFDAQNSERKAKWFEKIDEDNDGVITEAEREAAKSSREGKRRDGRRGGRN